MASKDFISGAGGNAASKAGMIFATGIKRKFMFDALKYVKMLEEAGFSREQAEASMKALMDAIENRIATKEDWLDLKFEIRSMRDEIKSFATKQDLSDLESKLTVRIVTTLIGSMTVLTAVFAAIVKLV